MKLPKELTTVTTLSKTVALIMFITLPIIGFLFGMRYQTMLSEYSRPILPVSISPISKPVACTLDVKTCPDGTAVGRTAPNCEFQKCPATQNNKGEKFSGPITSISYSCDVDGICGIGVGKVFVIVNKGEGPPGNTKILEAKGTFPQDLMNEEKKSLYIGKSVDVFAQKSDIKIGGTDTYTIFGNSEFYIKFMNDSVPQTQYTCPENGVIGCMPVLSDEGKRNCSPEAMAWYRANCHTFTGAAL